MRLSRRSILLLVVCVFVGTQIKAQSPRLFEEGTISTGDYETHPTFSPAGDELLFLKCLPDANFCMIYISFFKNGKWSTPDVAPFSGKYTDVDPVYTRDGNTVFFVSNRPVHQGDPVKPDWDIWKVSRREKSWGEPVHLGSAINTNENEYYPTLADNGTLYFGSSREGGKGRADIYKAMPDNDEFSEPVNLGDAINTTDNEYEPFIAPDESYLIFMATYPNGVANGDFYISYNRNGIWSKSEKLKSPINSSATEWGGKVTRDGKYFFFGSSRNKIIDVLPQHESKQAYEQRLHSAGNGLGDIYQIEFSAIGNKK